MRKRSSIPAIIGLIPPIPMSSTTSKSPVPFPVNAAAIHIAQLTINERLKKIAMPGICMVLKRPCRFLNINFPFSYDFFTIALPTNKLLRENETADYAVYGTIYDIHGGSKRTYISLPFPVVTMMSAPGSLKALISGMIECFTGGLKDPLSDLRRPVRHLCYRLAP